MKIFITVLLVVLVLLTILSPARAITANAYQIGPVQVLIPAQLTINFLASQNTFDSVESIAQSDYTLTKTSSSMTFQTSAIDQFTVTYNVSYASPQSQYVTLGMWSQGSLTNTQKFPVVDATQFTFVVILVTSTPVTYPTTDQILSGIQSRFTSQFDQYQSQLQQFFVQDQTNFQNLWTVTAVAIAVAGLGFLGVIYSIHRSGELEARILRVETRQTKSNQNNQAQQRIVLSEGQT